MERNLKELSNKCTKRYTLTHAKLSWLKSLL